MNDDVSAEYLDEHPCLCTSRFRHILHQLDHDRHKKLADLCSELQKLSMVSSNRVEICECFFPFLKCCSFD